MWIYIIIDFIAKIIAAVSIMIIHEMTKSFTYITCNPTISSLEKKKLLKPLHAIDPIGFLLFLSVSAGFSKPNRYRLKDQKTNFYIGISGLMILLILFFLFLGCAGLTIQYDPIFPQGTIWGYLSYAVSALIYRMALFSLSMFLVNLFPVMFLDMGNIIAGKSLKNYFKIMQMDFQFKSLVLFCITINLIYEIARFLLFSIL